MLCAVPNRPWRGLRRVTGPLLSDVATALVPQRVRSLAALSHVLRPYIFHLPGNTPESLNSRDCDQDQSSHDDNSGVIFLEIDS